MTALNIICFPIKSMDISILRDILRGGLDKMREAGVLLVGGHSVEDDEMKYGLAVTGTVHPEKVLLNRGARAGDALVLTKPLGTGIVNTALKAKMAPEGLVESVVRSMAELNKKAADLMAACQNIHACTDVTGFGLLGHAAEMIEDSDVGISIRSSEVPLFTEIKEFIEMGIVPGGLHRNRKFREHMVDRTAACPDWVMDALYDPQTSGGLLISLPKAEAEPLVKKMKEEGIHDAAAIGEIVTDRKGRITIE